MAEIIDAGTQLVIGMLKEQYECPHFRILVIGRANAGKTTILEKICGVARGTKPIIYDENGVEVGPNIGPTSKPKVKSSLKFKLLAPIKQVFHRDKGPPPTHLTPSIERGIHNIEHQITYPGSNFIFHDSQGFESGASGEIEIVLKFIEKRSAAVEMKDQLHAIWYCIPMDSPRPLLSTELGFFNKGMGKVPLVVVFTKYDAQIIQESVKLNYLESFQDKWTKARENADVTFQRIYLAMVLSTQHPPRAHVRLEDMHRPERNCPELTQETANAIDDTSLHGLFVSTQMNNLDLCVVSALKNVLTFNKEVSWDKVILMVFSKFPHYWKDRNVSSLIRFSSRYISMMGNRR
ncbi:hypothetical protein AX14_006458 [Amanita brunnescens Koide BX004]|nr:hypothetical protein AX14_006458 [Amanita brunnescens Koide BX004]